LDLWNLKINIKFSLKTQSSLPEQKLSYLIHIFNVRAVRVAVSIVTGYEMNGQGDRV
jgi:hypothetical protein